MKYFNVNFITGLIFLVIMSFGFHICLIIEGRHASLAALGLVIGLFALVLLCSIRGKIED
jgi:uncharacterized membrane protein